MEVFIDCSMTVPRYHSQWNAVEGAAKIRWEKGRPPSKQDLFFLGGGGGGGGGGQLRAYSLPLKP